MPKTFLFMNQYDSSVNELIDAVLAHTGDANYSSSSLLWIIRRALRNTFHALADQGGKQSQAKNAS